VQSIHDRRQHCRGRNQHNHATASNPGTQFSAIGGTSGKMVTRAVETPGARTASALIGGAASAASGIRSVQTDA
jgi:hypothetical protein